MPRWGWAEDGCEVAGRNRPRADAGKWWPRHCSERSEGSDAARDSLGALEKSRLCKGSARVMDTPGDGV
jgi:hypothetical protein